MTLLGKIFTVLILVMSVLFMSFAIMVYATHVNWKVRADDLEQQAGSLKSFNNQLKVDIDDTNFALAKEQAARRFALAALQEQKVQAENERDQYAKQLSDLQAAHTQANATLQATQNRMDALTKEVVAVRAEVRSTQQDRDDKFALAVKKTDELNAMKGLRRDLEERQSQLILQNERFKQVMDAFGLTENTPIDDMAPPGLDGIVVAVGDKDLIEISIGSDDGLRVGHQLHVFRARSYLGKVVIRKTMPDKAVAEILRDYRQGLIKKGDSVASKLI